MKRLAVFAALTFVTVGSALVFSIPSAQVIQGAEVEQFLKKARFAAREPLGSGVSESLKVTLELDGKRQFAVLKTIDQSRPGARPNAAGRIEIDFQDSWRTEVAAYELDKLLGLGMVPATVERRSPYDGKPGSLQLWVEAAMSEADRRRKAVIPPDANRWAEELGKLYTFDALIYNTDRHPDNLLITDTFEVRLIDHSRSFRPNAELRNEGDLQHFSRALLERIGGLNKSVLGESLGDYLTLTQIDGLLRRRQLLLDLANRRARELGEPVVFYP